VFFSRLDLDNGLIFEYFADLHIALFIWLIMQLSTSIIVFVGFHSWINNRYNYDKHLSETRSLRNTELLRTVEMSIDGATFGTAKVAPSIDISLVRNRA
jgi:hypothetical protein